MGRIFSVTKKLFWNADTTTIRVILAASSLLFAIALLLPGLQKTIVAYYLMFEIARPEVWAALFLLHFLALSWRFIDQTPRLGWALAINSFGLCLWLGYILLINFSLQFFAPGTSTEMVLCVMAAWSLFRTGTSNELLTP